MSLLQFKDVSYWYSNDRKESTIFSKVNLEFEKGKFYTIVGPSGSGKTTLLSLAGALDIPKEGKIHFDGQDIATIGYSKFRNQYVSIVFQSYNLLPYMTALQNIVTAMEITKVKKKNKSAFALDMLRKVGISEEKAKQKVLTLSGGQQQRIAIARALCCETDLIIADEPTGNLDEDTARDTVKLFQHLAHEENKCIIVVTHDNSIANCSDVILRLSKGNFQISYNKKTRVSGSL
ncbi:ABC transporter ATP-binding protein [Jeotgalibacillus marinus]|uniref:ABC transporter ATP-binding protein n=1 Tax=Jeotgalibacillus marinus TaxID=86667 RepID=A0ABV3Q4A8_9BACL